MVGKLEPALEWHSIGKISQVGGTARCLRLAWSLRGHECVTAKHIMVARIGVQYSMALL
jgi:hypothetical protein